VVLAVRDLDAAGTRILEQLGLGSVPGGRHPGWGTGNRIVPLGEEYVELLAVADPAEAASSPVGTWIANASRSRDRLAAWCVSTDDIDGIARRLGLEDWRPLRAPERCHAQQDHRAEQARSEDCSDFHRTYLMIQRYTLRLSTRIV